MSKDDANSKDVERLRDIIKKKGWVVDEMDDTTWKLTKPDGSSVMVDTANIFGEKQLPTMGARWEPLHAALRRTPHAARYETPEQQAARLPPHDPEYERKVDSVIKQMEDMSFAEQAYMVGVVPFTNPLNITNFLSRKLGLQFGGLTDIYGDEKRRGPRLSKEEIKATVSPIYDAIDRFSASKKLSDPLKWISMASMLGKVSLEFRGIPGKGVGTRFAFREMMTMPTKYESDMSWDEYAKMKGMRTGEAFLVGTTVGVVSRYIPKARYRIPALTGSYMGFTAVKGGNQQQIIESGITILGFSALGLMEKAIKQPKMRAQYTKLAIETARKHNPTLYHLTDIEVAKVMKGVQNDMMKLGSARVQKATRAVESRMRAPEKAAAATIAAGAKVTEAGKAPAKARIRFDAAVNRFKSTISSKSAKLDAKYTPRLEAALKKGDVDAAKAISAQWEAELLGTVKAPPTKKPLLPTKPPKISEGKIMTEKGIEAREEALTRDEEGLKFRKALVEPTKPKPIKPTKPNPYSFMPIERVREDAQHGVKLAKEALAKLDPTYIIGKAATTPATNKQKQIAHMLKDRHHLTDEQYMKALKYSTGQDSMAKMSVEEADIAIRQLGNFDYMIGLTKEVAKAKRVPIDPLMPKGYETKILKAAGSDIVFNKALGYSGKAGGVPSNPKIPNLGWRQERYAQDIINVANIQRRSARLAAKREPVGKEYNVINPWSSARYAMAQAGVKSGVPLRRLYSNIVASANLVRTQNTKALNDALRRAGAPRIGSPLTFKQGAKIANWLFVNPEEEPALKTKYWADMKPKTQRIATEVHKFLQNESAFQVRWARWIKWDRAAKKADAQITKFRDKGVKLTKTRLDTIMKPVKNARPPNAPQDALATGRAAESSGQLLDWLSTQTWGTRKHYYMSERELVELTKMYPTGAIPEELEKMAAQMGGAPERTLPATMTREGKAKIMKGGSLLNAVLNHANRVGTFAATYDDLQKFWTSFASTKPSPQDIGRVRKLVNTSLGFRHSVDDWVKIGRFMNAWFWKPYFAFSPKRAAWFSYRNLHQNLAYGLTQIELKEAVKSSKALSATHMGTAMGEKLTQSLDRINPWMKEDYSKHWESRISQRKQMYQQFILQKQGSIVSDFGNRANTVIDTLASAPVYSDEINRLQAWPLMHQTAFRNVQQLTRGRITAKKFWTNLGMDRLHVDQRVEMHKLIDTGKWRQLVNNYAEYKTENIHFRYETGLRSVSEQTPGGRLVVGLATFPRGTFEIMYQNGLKPFIQGYESGNYRQSYDGLKTITMGIVGSRAAKGLLYAVTGRVAYGISDTVLRYTPVAPGPARLQELFDVVNETMWAAEEEDRSIGDTADTIMAATMYQSELFIPFCDVMLDIQETMKDDYGRSLYKILKNKARKRFYDETGKEFSPANRDDMEKFHHLFWGGDEKSSEKSPFYKFMLTGKLKKPIEKEGKVKRKVID